MRGARAPSAVLLRSSLLVDFARVSPGEGVLFAFGLNDEGGCFLFPGSVRLKERLRPWVLALALNSGLRCRVSLWSGRMAGTKGGKRQSGGGEGGGCLIGRGGIRRRPKGEGRKSSGGRIPLAIPYVKGEREGGQSEVVSSAPGGQGGGPCERDTETQGEREGSTTVLSRAAVGGGNTGQCGKGGG